LRVARAAGTGCYFSSGKSTDLIVASPHNITAKKKQIVDSNKCRLLSKRNFCAFYTAVHIVSGAVDEDGSIGQHEYNFGRLDMNRPDETRLSTKDVAKLTLVGCDDASHDISRVVVCDVAAGS